jgi:hypothetical protein
MVRYVPSFPAPVRLSENGNSQHPNKYCLAKRCAQLSPLYITNIVLMSTSTSELFTTTTVVSLLGVIAILVTAYAASTLLLPKSARAVDRNIFIWLCFDALIHFIFEGSFLWHSTFGRTVFRGTGPFAELCKPLWLTLCLRLHINWPAGL